MERLMLSASLGLPLALTFANFFLPPLPALVWSLFVLWVYLVLYIAFKLTRMMDD